MLPSKIKIIKDIKSYGIAEVKVYCNEKTLTIDSNGDRFGSKPQWLVLKKDDAIFLAKQIMTFYNSLTP